MDIPQICFAADGTLRRLGNVQCIDFPCARMARLGATCIHVCVSYEYRVWHFIFYIILFDSYKQCAVFTCRDRPVYRFRLWYTQAQFAACRSAYLDCLVENRFMFSWRMFFIISLLIFAMDERDSRYLKCRLLPLILLNYI
jgi:hypothetical protein